MLDQKAYFVKEQTKYLSDANSYDVLDPDTQEPLGVVHQTRSLWRVVFKERSGYWLNATDAEGNPVFSVRKPFSAFGRPKVRITDAEGNELGYLHSKMFSTSGGFWVYDENGEHIAEVKGSWKNRNFQILTNEGELLGQVVKEWAGISQELFTSADNYVIVLEDAAVTDVKTKIRILAAALCIDLFYNE